VAEGGIGELLVRGPTVMAGYHDDEAATRAALDAEGWLHTGDLGRRDADGRLRLAGRIKEMFKSGGYNVWPREVEAVIETHPAVALCVVVPMPDPVYHEVGCAFVVPAGGRHPPTPEDLAVHCRASLANYKVPKRFVVRGALPLLAVGKIDRRALAAEARALSRADVAGDR
jgi:acyl-CoA synthetase (AMP-forming)/AMP-acid ligase II